MRDRSEKLDGGETRQVNVKVPVELLPVMDMAVRVLDLDRSKFIRAAIREKASRVLGEKVTV
jgi:metal-responsive CopG/Arc/MetJ family transcriptional regulator